MSETTAMKKGESEVNTQIIAAQQGRTRELQSYVDMNIWVGREFKYRKGKTEYMGGGMYMRMSCWLKELNVGTLRRWVIQAYDIVCSRYPKISPKFQCGTG